jgi:hypothetical protein
MAAVQRASRCRARRGQLLAEFGVVALRSRFLFRRGIGLPESARHFPGDGLRGAWPGREPGAQRIDILVTEPVAEELLVGNAVELHPCLAD